ncbi:hypothetical protein E5S67_03129 [Microcoleus sp. IPMA8]|uniref:Uncharacterized protein n=1 Tax=Microcoleus asticus IPMA8 TaxID=2563858 RepID=A0ABX2D0M5_9CYAN|nr:hypothetical protein [Microcoleus asticus IPMA8]
MVLAQLYNSSQFTAVKTALDRDVYFHLLNNTCGKKECNCTSDPKPYVINHSQSNI